MVELRAAMSRHHGLQCGFCTPGMMLTARDIVARVPDAGERRIRQELSGNICRCTGYMGIVAAIRSVLADRATAKPRVKDTSRSEDFAGVQRTERALHDE